jgi:hypothetical protein
MTSNKRYRPFISSARSIEMGGGPPMICKSFPREFEAFSSTPRRVEKRIMDEIERYARRFPRGGRPIFVDEGGNGNMPVGSVLGGECMVTRYIAARTEGRE